MRLTDSFGVLLHFIGLGLTWVLCLYGPATIEVFVLACIAGAVSLAGLGILIRY